MNLREHFVKYEAVVHMADAVFDRVKKDFPKEVFCREKCSDCCYAIFDLTLIEALYLKDKFLKKFTGKEKNDLMEIVGKMSQERVRCPLLGENDLCVMYESRPLTCRVYGIPTSTAGVSHICGRTNFIQGQPYPTLNMDKMYTQLQLLSAQLVKDIKSKNIKMHEMLIPVSMTMVTDFNEEYLGVQKNA